MKLDRKVFKVYNFSSQAKEVDNYENYTVTQKTEVFNYLQSIAYNYDINNPPKMDKNVHSFRKNG